MTSPEYRDLYENAPDLYVTVDLETLIITDCNRTLSTMLGYEKRELVGQPMATIALEDDRFDTELADVERRLRRKDGSALEVSLSLRLLRGGAFATYRDITVRKRAERDRAFLLRLTNVMQRSTGIEQSLRMVSGELGVYVGAVRAFFFSVEKGRDHGTVQPGYTSDGRLLPARVELPFQVTELTVAVPDARDGRWTFVATKKSAWDEREIALVRNVAERAWLWLEHLRLLAQLRDRDVAAAVERTEERFGVLLEGVKDCAVFMLDARGRVATWNAGAHRLKQYRVEEAVGQPYEMFFSDEDVLRGRPRANLERAAREGRYEEEGWRIRKDGTRFWASVVITAIRGDDGTLAGFAKVAREIRTAALPRPSSDPAPSVDA